MEEARALAVPMLLSDIPVHREQMGCGATYFDAHDANDLAAKLRNVVVNGDQPTAVRGPNAQNDESVQRFAREFVSVAERAVAQ